VAEEGWPLDPPEALEALEVTEQSVEIYRRLTEGNPAAYEADLANLLSNLGNRLAEAGRHPQALEAEQQAVEMRRRQIEGNPGPQ
jgi:tetratricopeptide (TPR) repeat protein